MDFCFELQQMNDIFQRIKDLTIDDFKAPFWMDNESHKSYLQVYENLPQLYRNGEIVYACIIQANRILFKRLPPFNSIAVLIFSLDDFYKTNPLDLYSIADSLYSYKFEDNAPEGIKEVVRSIKDEVTQMLNIALPPDIANNRQIYLTNVVVHRNHLPKKRIISRLLPIICDVENVDGVMIVPKRYWTNNFIEHFICGRIQ